MIPLIFIITPICITAFLSGVIYLSQEKTPSENTISIDGQMKTIELERNLIKLESERIDLQNKKNAIKM